mmetsp:Transcript_43680/g.103093  ORF Transcript_43680/g.103093 Transcript_43680/m.103093 type:complete len:305 (+) Transcript_43680:85-999(+)
MFFCCLQKDHFEESISVNTQGVAVVPPSEPPPPAGVAHISAFESVQVDEPEPASTEPPRSGDQLYESSDVDKVELRALPQEPAPPADVYLTSAVAATKKSGSGITDTATSDRDRVFVNDPRRHTNGSLLPPEEFCIRVPKEQSGIGLDVEIVDDMVIVDQVTKGQLSTWSANNPGFEVRPADRIVEVNELAASTTDIMNALTATGNGELVIVIRRPRSFEVNLDRKGGDLGMALLAKKGRQQHLRVTKLKEDGVVPQWNRAHEDRRILPGDRLVQVNNFAGPAANMLEMLRTHEALELRLLRPN